MIVFVLRCFAFLVDGPSGLPFAECNLTLCLCKVVRANNSLSIVANSDWVRIRGVVGSCFGATDCLFRESGAAQHEAMHSQQPVLACVRSVMPMVSLRMTVSCCCSEVLGKFSCSGMLRFG